MVSRSVVLTAFCVVATALFVVGTVLCTIAYAHAAEQRPAIATCTIRQETATANSRSEVAYYECVALNGAVIPGVTFVVHADSPGAAWLSQLVGRTVDVRLEVVK